MCNVISLSYTDMDGQKLSQVSVKLAQAFAMVYGVEMTFCRFYLTYKAKELSVFLNRIQNQGCSTAGPSPEGNASPPKGIRLLVAFIVGTVEAFVSATSIHTTLQGSDSRYAWLDGYPYDTALYLLLWPTGMAYVVVLALATTSLDRMLIMLDQICVHAENLVSCSTAAVAGPKRSHTILTIEVEPKKAKIGTVNELNLAAEDLLQHFRNLQSLFKSYNRLIGPVVLVMIFTSTLLLIEAVTALLAPKDWVNVGWLNLVYMAQCCVYLTVLDDGHRATNVVSILCTEALIGLQHVVHYVLDRRENGEATGRCGGNSRSERGISDYCPEHEPVALENVCRRVLLCGPLGHGRRKLLHECLFIYIIAENVTTDCYFFNRYFTL